MRHNDASRAAFECSVYYQRGQLWSASLKRVDCDIERLVAQSTGERNYHILYSMLSGLDENIKKKKYGLKEAKDYFYLNQVRSCHFNVLFFHLRANALKSADATSVRSSRV